ncbi:hypothetical protein L211DRAFT_661209 [Terfezia boudieri ATCC MYA-4762]|uniref:GPI inositol-deacylase winged helix domain-containing protein n=1 Tax=Terfezia boudieri ATCC MYA-4762 TaxID=1051890 RepID=A0A3N4LVI3_9PEZI|nr:hypothetical protein L211DRAFT_661209 [Terfezia boudieri ATCC MYA-4762]
MPETLLSNTPMATGEKAETTPPAFPAGLETLLELTRNAAARSVDYLLVHEQSFKLIEHLTEFHAAITQAREQLRQVTKHTSMKVPAAETQEKSTEGKETTEDTENMETTESTEGMQSTESTESTENTEGAEDTERTTSVDPPEGASTVGGDASSVQLSDTALQLFLDKKEEAAPLSGMWSQLFDMTMEKKRGANNAASACMESGQQENCEACVNDTLEVGEQRGDNKLREENGKDSKVHSEEPLPTLVRLMDRLAPVIVEIGPQLKAMAAVAKTEEQKLRESSDTITSKPLAKWCTCGEHTEDGDDSSSTKDDSDEEESTDPMINHLRKQCKMYKDFTSRIAEDPELRKDIIETIASKSEGIETVANVHLARVSRTLTVKGAREVLFALPLGPADTYALVMRDIEKHESPDRALAKKALMWLTNALQPLTVSEFLHVLNPDLSYHTSKVGDFKAKVRRLCGALFELGPSADIVSIAPTVKEYLQTNHPDLFTDPHWSMAHDCIQYFSLPEFSKGCAEWPQKRTDKFPFLEYAAHNWARHSRRVTPDKTQQMRKFVLKFLSQIKKTASAIQVIQAKVWGSSWAWASDQLGFFKSQASKRILVAAFFGLNDLVIQELNVRGSQICNCVDSQGQSLLSLAAERDNLTLDAVAMGCGEWS